MEKITKDEKKTKRPSLMRRFFWWCAGVDEDLIQQCTKQEQAKYASMGATIMFTGLFAALAGGYALYAVFRDGTSELKKIDRDAIFPALFFGLLWGAMIFNLDRYIITSFSKSSSPSRTKRFFHDLLQATPRIMIAVIIAITISKPIEVKLFETRLAKQIEDNKQAAMAANEEISKQIYGIEETETKKDSLENKRDQYLTKKEEKPQGVIDLEKQLDYLIKDRNQAETDEKTALENAKRIYNNDKNWNYSVDSLGRRYKTNLKESPRNQYKEYKRKEKENKEKKEIKNEEIKIKNEEIVNALETHRNQFQSLADGVSESIETTKVALTENISRADSLRNSADKVAEIAYGNTFITQLEALSDLKRAHINEKDTPEQIKEKEESARSMWWLSFFITLLVLAVELTPILTKLITRRGKYEMLVDLDESKAEDSVATNLNIWKNINEERAKAEVEENKDVFVRMAEAQSKLLEVAINEWREEELKKIKENPSNYIKSNTSTEA